MIQSALTNRFLRGATRHKRIFRTRGKTSFLDTFINVRRRSRNFYLGTIVGRPWEKERPTNQRRVEGYLKEATGGVNVVLRLLLLLRVPIRWCMVLPSSIGHLFFLLPRPGALTHGTYTNGSRAFRSGPRRLLLRIIVSSQFLPRGTSCIVRIKELPNEGYRFRRLKETVGGRSVTESLIIVSVSTVGVTIRCGHRMFAIRLFCLRIVRQNRNRSFVLFRTRKSVICFRDRHATLCPGRFVRDLIALRQHALVMTKDRNCITVRTNIRLVVRGGRVILMGGGSDRCLIYC